MIGDYLCRAQARMLCIDETWHVEAHVNGSVFQSELSPGLTPSVIALLSRPTVSWVVLSLPWPSLKVGSIQAKHCEVLAPSFSKHEVAISALRREWRNPGTHRQPLALPVSTQCTSKNKRREDAANVWQSPLRWRSWRLSLNKFRFHL